MRNYGMPVSGNRPGNLGFLGFPPRVFAVFAGPTAAGFEESDYLTYSETVVCYTDSNSG